MRDSILRGIEDGRIVIPQIELPSIPGGQRVYAADRVANYSGD